MNAKAVVKAVCNAQAETCAILARRKLSYKPMDPVLVEMATFMMSFHSHVSSVMALVKLVVVPINVTLAPKVILLVNQSASPVLQMNS